MDLVDTLRGDILSGVLPPGADLSQSELAQRFGVSRIPVRDALQRLAAEKLVTVATGKGARVIRLDRAALAEVYETRLLLECALVIRATRLATPDDHGAVEHALKVSNLEAGRPGWSAGDWRFHTALYAPAGRPLQLDLVRDLRRTCQIHAAHYDRLATNTPRWLDDHAKLCDAFRAGDPDRAGHVLAGHILAARDHLLALMPD